jgi:hypothetical protein
MLYDYEASAPAVGDINRLMMMTMYYQWGLKIIFYIWRVEEAVVAEQKPADPEEQSIVGQAGPPSPPLPEAIPLPPEPEQTVQEDKSPGI